MIAVDSADAPSLKDAVRDHWERETCGIRYGTSVERRLYFEEIEESRYQIEPYIPAFARFDEGRDRRVLEIGVGAGSDFSQWVRSGAIASGVDLTDAAIDLTREHLATLELDTSRVDLRVADAEQLPFDDSSFDIVYSWGVLHHSPDTEQAFREVNRVLRPGGVFRGMVYHVPSWSGWMVWAMQSLLRGKPFRSVKRSLFEHLESPGTKAYSLREARAMLKRDFTDIRLATRLNPGDLLLIRPSEKYDRPLHRLIFRVYPRWLVLWLGDRFGLNLMIEAHRPRTG
jgi:ubiquinone/menaquinone biosynthesis C-methylase UbiE